MVDKTTESKSKHVLLFTHKLCLYIHRHMHVHILLLCMTYTANIMHVLYVNAHT